MPRSTSQTSGADEDCEPVPSAHEQQERLRFQLVREAPYLPGARDLAAASSPVDPWPHQLRVIRRTAERYPQSFLFADEVGLGKTVEAALVLRRLLLAEKVRRVLILVPKAVLRQWQEELHEKAALDVPVLVGGDRCLDLHGRPVEVERADPSPWNRHPVLLASTQLARDRRRAREILQADPWDLVIVDEAHHARRRNPDAEGRRRPNRLLELLTGPSADPGGLVAHTRCLYLLTATPMQIHPVEVWDLLVLLGLGGRWGAGEEGFVSYFEQLHRPFEDRDWSRLLPFLAETELDEDLVSGLSPELRGLLRTPTEDRVRALGAEDRRRLDQLLRQATPVRGLVWRHTRSLLREYHRRGLLESRVPERRPENVWIELTPEERDLYDRIDDYLSLFYHRYEARRKGLGFVMTLYRRRLTSSFRAIRRSLARRIDLLEGRGPIPGEGADGTGGSWDELDADSDEADGGPLQHELFEPYTAPDATEGEAPGLPVASRFSRDELSYLQTFLEDLDRLRSDSKLERLRSDLGRLLKQRDRVLVFTQYLDTLDHLHQDLAADYTVACYSGRGGELSEASPDGFRRIPCAKEELTRRFGAGEIQVMLCTEAAGEGLNLQTCGVLINYDMPWNPMRVEQRIGRIDRIGQRHDAVWVKNYFYADTVEATVYRRLTRRIEGFKSVLGELQPILHRVGEALEELALTPAGRRPKRLEEELRDLDRDLERRPPDVLDPGVEGSGADDPGSDDPAAADSEAPLEDPFPARDLESLFLGSRALGHLFEPVKEEEGVHRLRFEGREHRVTFRPECFRERTYSLELLTWGRPLFEALLASVPAPEWDDRPGGIGFYRTRRPAPVSVVLSPGRSGVLEPVASPESLEKAFRRPGGPWSGALEGAASRVFSRARRQLLQGRAQVEAARRAAESQALTSACEEVLAASARLDLAGAHNPGLFDRPLGFGFGTEAVRAQGRHGPPFDRLLEVLLETGKELPTVGPRDPRYLELREKSPEKLRRLRAELVERGQDLVERRRRLEEAEAAARREQREGSLAGLLERRYARFGDPDAEAEKERSLDLDEVSPFENAVPCFDDPGSLARFLAESEGKGLEDLAERPENGVWVELGGRFAPARDLCLCRFEDDALEPRVPAGADLVLRVERRPPRPGDLVLVEHPAVVDEDGSSAVIRYVDFEHDGETGSRRVRLSGGDGAVSWQLEDEEVLELVVHARVVEILG